MEKYKETNFQGAISPVRRMKEHLDEYIKEEFQIVPGKKKKCPEAMGIWLHWNPVKGTMLKVWKTQVKHELLVEKSKCNPERITQICSDVPHG